MSRSDSNNGSVFDVWELQFNGKGVEDCTGKILKFKFVSVLINFKDVENFSVDIEISFLFSNFVKIFGSVSTSNFFRGEMAKSPGLESLLDSRILFLVGGSLS